MAREAAHSQLRAGCRISITEGSGLLERTVSASSAMSSGAVVQYPSVPQPIELSTLRRHNDEILDDRPVDDQHDVVIHLDNVHKTYLLGIEGVPALRGVTLSVRRGELVVVFGTSGGGKTTLLNVIGTIDKPTKGQLFLFGNRITSKTQDSELAAIRSKKMGFVFQTFNLLSSMTALENVEMPMILLGRLGADERRQRAISLLKRVGMGHRLDHYPAQLSGGEQQRVTIARAIANQPELLLLDEPTGDLDTHNGHIVLKMLLELNAEGMTMVFVTHDVNIKNYAHRVVRMRDGKIAQIEEIAPHLREQAIQQLAAQLGEKVLTVGVDPTEPAPTTAPASASAIDWRATEMRQPTAYAYVNYRPRRAAAAAATAAAAAAAGSAHSEPVVGPSAFVTAALVPPPPSLPPPLGIVRPSSSSSLVAPGALLRPASSGPLPTAAAAVLEALPYAAVPAPVPVRSPATGGEYGSVGDEQAAALAAGAGADAAADERTVFGAPSPAARP